MQEAKIQRKVRPTHPGTILRNMLAELADKGNGQVASLTQKELKASWRIGAGRQRFDSPASRSDRRHSDPFVASL